MPHPKPPSSLLHATYALILTGLVSPVLPGSIQPTLAQSIESVPEITTSDLADGQIIFNIPDPPDFGSPGGRRQGGASRGPCRAYESLTAITPTIDEKVWSTTAEAHPTFWFYVPPASAGTSLEFVLQDEADNVVYYTSIEPTATTSGIIRIDLPPTAPALEVDKTYAWTFSAYCNPASPSASVYVRGTVQRVALDEALTNQIAAATPQNQASLYAANGIWHEAITLLAELRQREPNNLEVSTAWGDLLRQVELDAITSSPFSPCCTPTQALSPNDSSGFQPQLQ